MPATISQLGQAQACLLVLLELTLRPVCERVSRQSRLMLLVAVCARLLRFSGSNCSESVDEVHDHAVPVVSCHQLVHRRDHTQGLVRAQEETVVAPTRVIVHRALAAPAHLHALAHVPGLMVRARARAVWAGRAQQAGAEVQVLVKTDRDLAEGQI